MRAHFREPIKHTCPDIDNYIKKIQWAIVAYRDLKQLDTDILLESAISMSAQLEECINYLEDLRASNGTLRDWGIEEAKRVDELENQLDELKQPI